MGTIADFINKFKSKNQSKIYAKMLNGFTPIFNMFGDDIYASDVVVQAISCITQEMSKLNPQHLLKGVPQNGQLQKVLNQPNEHMCQSDFLEKFYWELLTKYNAFIIPTYDRSYDRLGNEVKTLTGLYPISPIRTEFLEDASGRLFVSFKFYNNYETTLRYEDVIHIRYRYSFNEYMGGNALGHPDHEALLKTLDLNETLLTGVSKALKSSFAVNGIIKYKTLLDDGSMDANIKKIEERLLNNDSGFLPMDIQGEFIPLQNKIQLVDSTTLKFIDDKILRHFGVPLGILTGSYDKSLYEAFYQKTLEPLIKKTAEAFTMSLFTDREKGFDNKIVFFSKDLIFMTNSEKLEYISLVSPTGTIFENEKRIMVGLSPLPELDGIRMMSLNWINVDDAQKYQIGTTPTNSKEDTVKEENVGGEINGNN